jgi:hypothetical protein
MEVFAAIVAIIVGLVGLDLAALRWGVDSRHSDPDGGLDSYLERSRHHV